MGIKTFTLRLNDKQHEFLEKKALEQNVSKNDYIRMLLDGEIKDDKQEKIMKELTEIKDLLLSQEKKNRSSIHLPSLTNFYQY